MAKLTLTDLTQLSSNETSAVNSINNNNAAIETALENTLSRDGTSPNTMSADIDLNSNKVINVADPTNNQDAVTLSYGNTNFGGQSAIDAAASAAAALVSENAAAVSETNAASSEAAAAVSAATIFTPIAAGTQTYTDGVDYTSGTTQVLKVLGVIPGDKDAFIITFDGQGQHHDTFSVATNGADTDITFDAVIPLGILSVEVKWSFHSTSIITASDSTFIIQDDVDNTKAVAFQVSGVSTGTTRTLTVPDANDTLVGLATTDTLTNKTLTNPFINSINGVTAPTAQYTTAEETKLAGIETAADVTDSTNVLSSLVGQEVVATGFTGTLDGILGGGTPAAATVTTLTASSKGLFGGATGVLGGNLEVITGATGVMATFGGATGDDLYLINHAAGVVGLQVNSADTLRLKSNTVSFHDQAGTSILNATTSTADFNAANLTTTGTLSAGNTTVQGSAPILKLYEDDVTADNGKWRMAAAAEQFTLQTLNDAESVASTFMLVNRTGTTVDNVTFHTGAGNTNLTLAGGATPTATFAGSLSAGATDVTTLTATGDAALNGVTTKPNNPCFLVYKSIDALNVTGNGAQYPVTFDTEVFDYGGNFASNTFTAPVTGAYQLNVVVVIDGIASAIRSRLRLVLSNKITDWEDDNVADTRLNLKQSWLVDMDAGDTVSILVRITGMVGNTADVKGTAGRDTQFSGFLVG